MFPPIRNGWGDFCPWHRRHAAGGNVETLVHDPDEQPGALEIAHMPLFHAITEIRKRTNLACYRVDTIDS